MFLVSLQASSQEGASKVFELLQGKVFRSVGWSTLFDCLSIYDEKFKQSLQTAGALLPEFPEGDAKALVAYLNVLQKVFMRFSFFNLFTQLISFVLIYRWCNVVISLRHWRCHLTFIIPFDVHNIVNSLLMSNFMSLPLFGLLKVIFYFILSYFLSL